MLFLLCFRFLLENTDNGVCLSSVQPFGHPDAGESAYVLHFDTKIYYEILL
jgi:hypothetical protein